MIIYIHGFGSSGMGGKAMQFREYFASKNEPFLSPSLSYIPELAIDTLEQLITSCDDVTLMGSSLGGYYSIYLAEKYGLKCVLINPAVESSRTLSRMINEQKDAKNYYDDSRFTWDEPYIDMLKKYYVTSVKHGKYMLLLQKGDDVLDYREVVAKIPHARLILEEGGSHPFEAVERHFDTIHSFLRTTSKDKK
jgi:predicted esterase YcpF (UPF0227 family)